MVIIILCILGLIINDSFIPVLAVESFFVTQSARSLDWPGYGLKLEVPQKSLPSGTERCTITITASGTGQYKLPSTEHQLVSPVFWLNCEPKIEKFENPLCLKIQHCALVENSSSDCRLVMVRAERTPKPPYLFKALSGANFSKSNTYGIIALDQFSGVGVAQEGSTESRRYWYNVFYMGPPNRRQIHFTVTLHLDAHITVSSFE